MKQHRTGIRLILVLILTSILFGCATKLSTVRPAEISELRVERLADGVIVSLPQNADDADKKDRLIFQLEEPYNKTGNCNESDGHLYDVSLYIMDRLDTHVIINRDGSVCKNGKRYIPSQEADVPVMIEEWDALFVSEQLDPGMPAETSAMDIVAAQGELKLLPEEAEILQSVAVTDILPWSYHISDVRYNNQNYVLLWRDTPKGDDAEWICGIVQTGNDTALRHNIEYVAGSYERSSEKYLYFTITDATTFHRSLWCFNPETLYFNQLLDTPCSNMILLQNESKEIKGLGWIVCDHSLIAIDLTQGNINETMCVDLREYINDNPFYEIGAGYTHKFVTLTDLGDNSLEIELITAEPESSVAEQRQIYQINLLTHKFSAIP